MQRIKDVQSFKRPSERAQRSLYSLIRNTESLVSDESDWIRYGPDLAALSRGAEHGWFNNFLEDSLNTISRRFTTVSPSFFLSVVFLAFSLLVHLGFFAQRRRWQ